MFFVNLLASFSFGSAKSGSQACLFLFLDEPECPETLVK